MKVNEIFYSIQGEGILQGVPMVFVRLQGCNFKQPCKWCDTQYSFSDKIAVENLPPEEVKNRVIKLLPYPGSWVCITGGEPLNQEEELWSLCKLLVEKELYRVEVETNGSVKLPRWNTVVTSWCIDIKTPSSGNELTNKLLIDSFFFNTRHTDQIKFVVADRTDLEFARNIIQLHPHFPPRVLISPMIPTVSATISSENLLDRSQEWWKECAEFCKEERVRLSLQLHKLIWGTQKRGV